MLDQKTENIFQTPQGTVHCTVWKFQKFSLTEKIFREINSLVTYLVKPLLSRNFCQKSVRALTTPSGNYGILLLCFFLKKFRCMLLYKLRIFTDVIILAQ